MGVISCLNVQMNHKNLKCLLFLIKNKVLKEVLIKLALKILQGHLHHSVRKLNKTQKIGKHMLMELSLLVLISIQCLVTSVKDCLLLKSCY